MDYQNLVHEFRKTEVQFSAAKENVATALDHAEFAAELERLMQAAKDAYKNRKTDYMAYSNQCNQALNFLFRIHPDFVAHRKAHNTFLNNKMVHLLLKIRKTEAVDKIQESIETTVFPSYKSMTYFANGGVLEEEPVTPAEPVSQEVRAEYDELNAKIERLLQSRQWNGVDVHHAKDAPRYLEDFEFRHKKALEAGEKSKEAQIEMAQFLFHKRPVVMSRAENENRIVHNEVVKTMLRIRRLEIEHKMELTKSWCQWPHTYLIDFDQL